MNTAETPTKPPKILLIRRDSIGDLVCTTSLITALRQRFPQVRITRNVTADFASS